MKKFKDKIVCITGSSSGIGEATAYRFAEEGARLLLIALEEDKLQEVKQKKQMEQLLLNLIEMKCISWNYWEKTISIAKI